MLVLSRKLGESIIIVASDGKEILVRVAKIEDDKVKLAIQAPKEIPIHRKEVLDTICESNKEAPLISKKGSTVLPKAALKAASEAKKIAKATQ